MTLADQVTLARLGLMPIIVASYLLLPVPACLWTVGWLCALAEYTDLLDGRIARARGEVSDFGKLADPFCDVVYRIGVFLTLLLPGGYASSVVGFPVQVGLDGPGIALVDVPGQLVVATKDGSLHAGLIPWLPVFVMVMREVVAGALRAMTATKGLVLAARTSGKVKAWLQGVTIIFCVALPAVLFAQPVWVLHLAWWMAWGCALVSVASIIEYIWVNRDVLRQLTDRRPA